MIRKLLFVSVVVGAAIGLGAFGCGQSGSNPTEPREIRITVEPLEGGTAQFQVVSLFVSLVTGDVDHAYFAGQQFTITAPLTIAVLGASAYSAKFQQIDDTPIRVTGFVSGETDMVQDTSAQNATVTVTGGGGATAHGNATPEVRFDICVPVPGTSSCLTADDSGVSGIGFTGTIGDASTTHLLPAPCAASYQQPCTTTPTIYFLEGASESVNGVFNAGPYQNLLVRLLINGVVRETKSGPNDLVLREDL